MKNYTRKIILFVALLVLPLIGSVLFFSPEVSAATITVDITAHEDSEPAAGTGCSYFEAMQAANTNAAYGGCPAGDAGEDTINIPAGTYDISSVFNTFQESIRLIGDTSGGTFLDGGEVSIYPGDTDQTFLVEDITIQNSSNSGFSANMSLDGSVITLRRVTVRNSAGNGLYYYKYLGYTGTITIEDSLFENNEWDGLYNDECGQGGTMNITNSIIRNNGGYGLNNSCGHLNVQSSTISNNAAGGIDNRHILDLTNVTVYGNGGHGVELYIMDSYSDLFAESHMTNVTIADNDGAGIYGGSDNADDDEYDEFTIYNTLIANNVGGNCAFEEDFAVNYPASGNHNMATDGTCDELMSESDSVTQVSNAFLADSLADNGGSAPIGSGGLDGNVLTLALLEGSPAIDAGNDAYCPVTDERNAGRPYGNGCDIGAYETFFTAQTIPTPSNPVVATLASTGKSILLYTLLGIVGIITAVVFGKIALSRSYHA